MKGFRRAPRPQQPIAPDPEPAVEKGEADPKPEPVAAQKASPELPPTPVVKAPRKRATSKRKAEVLGKKSLVTIPISQEAKTEARQALESAIAGGNYAHQHLNDIMAAAVMKFIDGDLGTLMPVHKNSLKENASFKLTTDQRKLYDTKLPRSRRGEIVERILRTYVNQHYPSMG